MCVVIQIGLASSEDKKLRDKSCLQRARDCLNRLQKLMTHLSSSTNEITMEMLSFTIFDSPKEFLESLVVLELEIELLSMKWETCDEILSRKDYSQLSLDLLKYCAGNLFFFF
jgi:hypothetical protein